MAASDIGGAQVAPCFLDVAMAREIQQSHFSVACKQLFDGAPHLFPGYQVLGPGGG